MAGTKRVPLRRATHQIITPRAVALFALTLKRRGKDDDDLDLELHRELGLKPWDDFVTWVDARGTSPASKLRHELLVLVKASRPARASRTPSAADVSSRIEP
jgi:hypothetical protein